MALLAYWILVARSPLDRSYGAVPTARCYFGILASFPVPLHTAPGWLLSSARVPPTVGRVDSKDRPAIRLNRTCILGSLLSVLSLYLVAIPCLRAARGSWPIATSAVRGGPGCNRYSLRVECDVYAHRVGDASFSHRELVDCAVATEGKSIDHRVNV